jgi:hypothetical protein
LLRGCSRIIQDKRRGVFQLHDDDQGMLVARWRPSVSADKSESTVLGEQVRDPGARLNGHLRIWAVLKRSPIRALFDTKAEVRYAQLISRP